MFDPVEMCEKLNALAFKQDELADLQQKFGVLYGLPRANFVDLLNDMLPSDSPILYLVNANGRVRFRTCPRELLQPPAQIAWRPIETVPFHRYVLVACRGTHPEIAWLYFVAMLCMTGSGNTHWMHGANDDSSVSIRLAACGQVPLYWCPVPAPPE